LEIGKIGKLLEIKVQIGFFWKIRIMDTVLKDMDNGHCFRRYG